MMTLTKKILMLIAMAMTLGLTSCVDEEEFDDTNAGNFEALWKIMDEHYCFFDVKEKELGVDWDKIHTEYAKQVNGADNEQLFEVLARMIGELRDGHVNLYSGFDIGRNWSWKDDYPINYSDVLMNKYIGTDYRIASTIDYCIFDDNIGYMRVESFSDDIGEGNLDNILYYMLACRSLIIDVRSNSGGQIEEAERLASRFTNEDILVGYMQHKTGTGHNDFSQLEEQRLAPSSRFRWQKPVFVLTDRAVYSAANEFVKYMKECEQCTVVGDKTGGGAGLPFSSQLPNGWGVRFSACPMYDAQGNTTENGIEPDVECMLTDEDMIKGVDTVIECARSLTK